MSIKQKPVPFIAHHNASLFRLAAHDEVGRDPTASSRRPEARVPTDPADGTRPPRPDASRASAAATWPGIPKPHFET